MAILAWDHTQLERSSEALRSR